MFERAMERFVGTGKKEVAVLIIGERAPPPPPPFSLCAPPAGILYPRAPA